MEKRLQLLASFLFHTIKCAYSLSIGKLQHSVLVLPFDSCLDLDVYRLSFHIVVPFG
jgi:hypothetical protein